MSANENTAFMNVKASLVLQHSSQEKRVCVLQSRCLPLYFCLITAGVQKPFLCEVACLSA